MEARYGGIDIYVCGYLFAKIDNIWFVLSTLVGSLSNPNLPEEMFAFFLESYLDWKWAIVYRGAIL